MDNSSGENKPVKTYEFPMVPEVGDTLTLSDKEVFVPELRILPTQITAKEVGSDKIFYKAVLVGKVVKVFTTDEKITVIPILGQTYWTSAILKNIPTQVKVLEIDEKEGIVRVEQGCWISIKRLYYTEDECLQR